MKIELTKVQQDIVDEMYGPVLVVAVPGAGKTTVLLARVWNMIQKGIKPEEILVVTYSDAAVQDMQRRFYKEYGCNKIRIITIHAFCCDVIKHAWREKELIVVTDSMQMDFFRKQVRMRMSVSDNSVDSKARQIISIISKSRNEEREFRKLSKTVKDIYVEYRTWKSDWQRCKGTKMVDYDDMINIAWNILSYNGAECAYWQKKYKYLCVDEFQDANSKQLELLWNLTESDGNICVVGDDDQSIYGFRGANPQIMQAFIRLYPDCKQFHLDINYRSLPEIVNAAARLIKHNKNRIEKSLKTQRRQGNTESFIKRDCPGYTDMLDNMMADISTLYYTRGMLYKDMAILYRANKQILPVISELLRRNIPFKCEGDLPDIHQEVFYKDIESYYKLTTEPDIKTLLNVLNHPKRNLNERDFKDCEVSKEAFIERLQVCGRYSEEALAEKINAVALLFDLIEMLKDLKPTEFVRCFLTPEYIDWLIAKSELHPNAVRVMLGFVFREASEYDSMKKWMDSFKGYVKRVKAINENKDAITLTTFHSSKGLEWKQIFLIDVNDGMMPYSTATSEDELEEERRLFYVALTRAKNCVHLYVTGKPSPYLEEMELIPSATEEVTIEQVDLRTPIE